MQLFPVTYHLHFFRFFIGFIRGRKAEEEKAKKEILEKEIIIQTEEKGKETTRPEPFRGICQTQVIFRTSPIQKSQIEKGR